MHIRQGRSSTKSIGRRRGTMTLSSKSERRIIPKTHPCELPKSSDSHLPKLPPNARFYARWRRSFQKLLLVSVTHPSTRLYLRSRASVAFERKRHGRSRYWWLIHPYSNLRYGWDFLMTLVLLYTFVVMPHVAAFHRITKSASTELLKIVYPAYVACIMDIALNFVTGFVSSDGHEVFLDPVLVIRQYSRGYFFVDLLSSVPYTWFGIGGMSIIDQPGPHANSALLIVELLPVLKVLRLPTLRRYVRQINRSWGVSHAPEMTIWLILLTILIFHWSACVTYAFPYVLMHVLGLTAEESEVYAINTKLYQKPTWKIYLTSLHNGVCNLVGSSSEESMLYSGAIDKTIRCVLLFLGKGYKIYLIVIILQLVKSSAEPELKYQEMMHQVKEYMRKKKLPAYLKDKLVAFYEYRYQGSYFKENAISSTLSSHLRQEIILHGSHGLLETATIFHNLAHSALGHLMSVLKPLVYLRDDVIYKAETDSDAMYFIASGTVALITFSGVEVCHAKDGEHFGETGLIYPDRRRRPESAIALEVCELLRFDRRDFKRLAPVDSEFYKKLEKVALKRYAKIQELDEQSPNEQPLGGRSPAIGE